MMIYGGAGGFSSGLSWAEKEKAFADFDGKSPPLEVDVAVVVVVVEFEKYAIICHCKSPKYEEDKEEEGNGDDDGGGGCKLSSTTEIEMWAISGSRGGP
ncbi:hypothetical protein TYRP_009500 [Tyrophagus putrescentiae]|nr:hypothetical protein TYRP_009500 [Tyrophagus putrescentiae]